MLKIKKITKKLENLDVEGQCNDPCMHDCIEWHGNKIHNGTCQAYSSASTTTWW